MFDVWTTCFSLNSLLTNRELFCKVLVFNFRTTVCKLSYICVAPNQIFLNRVVFSSASCTEGCLHRTNIFFITKIGKTRLLQNNVRSTYLSTFPCRTHEANTWHLRLIEGSAHGTSRWSQLSPWKPGEHECGTHVPFPVGPLSHLPCKHVQAEKTNQRKLVALE